MLFDIDRLFKEMNALRRELDNSFGQVGFSTGRASFPLINIYDTAEDIIVAAELPGVEQDNVHITMENELLKLSGRISERRYGEKTVVLREERCHGDFEKTVRIPVSVRADAISATLQNGVLMVTLPKAEEAKPKRITINA